MILTFTQGHKVTWKLALVQRNDSTLSKCIDYVAHVTYSQLSGWSNGKVSASRAETQNMAGPPLSTVVSNRWLKIGNSVFTLALYSKC